MIILQLWRRQPVPAWLWFGLLGVLAGAVLLLVAPGNAVRMSHESFSAYYSLAWHERVLSFIPQYMKVQWSMAPLYVFSLFCLWMLHRTGQRLVSREWGVVLFLFALSQGAVGVLVFAPYIPLRTLTATHFFCVLAVMFFLVRVAPFCGVGCRVVGVLCVCTLAGSMATQGVLLWDAHNVFVERERLLRSKSTEVALPPYPEGNRYFFMGVEVEDISDKNENWVNDALSKAYAKEKVVLGRPEYERAEEVELQLNDEQLWVEPCDDGLLVVRKNPQSQLGEHDIWIAHAHSPLTFRGIIQPLIRLFTHDPIQGSETDRTSMKMRFSLKKCKYIISATDTGQWLCRIPFFAQGKEMMLGIDGEAICQYKIVQP